MKTNNKYRVASSVFFICFLLLSVIMCKAGESDREDSAPVTLEGTIMGVDFVNAWMNVSETQVYLQTYEKDGKRQWKTGFQDKNGHEISVDTFKVDDRVRMKGVRRGENEIIADEIILLRAKQTDYSKPQPTVQPEPQSSAPLRLKDGKWIN